MLELAICDDDIILCNWLEQKLLHYGKANDCQISIEIYYSAEQLLNRLEEESYDMLFLDICLEHENGIDIGTEIRKKNYGKELRITYISTYQEYAMKLFRIHPFDFLVKPIREEELFRVIGELRELLKERKKIFEYTDTKGIHKISYDKILYFYSLGKRVHIVTSEKEYEYRGKLKDVADVTEEYFLLIHKSYLINMEHVEHYEYDNVVMKDKTRLSISKANRKKVIRDLRKLKDNDDVKAVVLRVNSPGGSAFASEQIWHAVKELKTKKPVIVSMGDYAASGGYYISCVADTIVAEPTTLTGSIGIFGMIPNVKGLTDKIGLSYDVVKTNKYADFGNIMRPFNEDEKSLLQMMITEGYDTFVTRCAEGRHMTKVAIEKIAEGRVWTGETAKELGLVDELGGIDKALDIAVAKAGIEGYTVVSYPEKQDFLSSLLDTKPTNYVESQLLKSKLGEYYQQFGLLKNLQEQSMIQARIPFELNIK